MKSWKLFGRKIRVRVVTLFFIGAAVALSGAGAASAQETPRGNVNVLLGQRNLSSDWDPVDKQTTFAVEVDFASADWPVNVIFGMAGSVAEEDTTVTVTDGWRLYDVNVTLEGKTSEIYGGGRKYFDTGSPMAPYIGAGLSFIKAELSASAGGYKVSLDDTSAGLFIDGGLVYRVGSFNIGLDLRLLTGTSMEAAGYSTDANYTQAALVIGYGW
ncbi:MAG: outer membrane beta-barrel protein [Candidatus Nitrospinota bacterium M3_3B_026]